MSIRTSLHASVVVALAVSSCGGDDSASTAKPQTPGEALCAAVAAAAEKCAGAKTPCDDALVADCAGIVGELAPGFVSAARACVEAGKKLPTQCFLDAALGLSPTPAQKALAKAFCDNCALGAPGCEQAFYQGDGSAPALGAAFLPWSDDVIQAVQAECTGGPTCATTFVNCAEGVLAKKAIPAETAKCMLETLVSPPKDGAGGGSPGTCTGTGGAGGATSASRASSGASSSSSSSTSSSSGAGGGGGGSACDFTASDTCDAPVDLGTVPGDSGSSTLNAIGVGSAWFKLTLAETDSWPGGHDLKVHATLAVPPGMKYGLWAYTDCATIVPGPGGLDDVALTFKDALGQSDTREIILEVRYDSGTACDPSASWSLKVAGNQ